MAEPTQDTSDLTAIGPVIPLYELNCSVQIMRHDLTYQWFAQVVQRGVAENHSLSVNGPFPSQAEALAAVCMRIATRLTTRCLMPLETPILEANWAKGAHYDKNNNTINPACEPTTTIGKAP